MQATSGLSFAVKLMRAVIKPNLPPSLKAISYVGPLKMGQSEREKCEWTGDSVMEIRLFRYQK